MTFEDWQTIGRFYSVTVGFASTTKGENGYEARAVVYNGGTVVISAAEGICTRSKRKWKHRNEYALKSMAQTRTCAKALRNVLAWVAVVADFEGTLAEEIEAANGAGGTQAKWNGKCPNCLTTNKYHAKDCPRWV